MACLPTFMADGLLISFSLNVSDPFVGQRIQFVVTISYESLDVDISAVWAFGAESEDVVLTELVLLGVGVFAFHAVFTEALFVVGAFGHLLSFLMEVLAVFI